MNKVVWLASYPKSGNTWMRLLIANLQAEDRGAVPLHALSRRRGIASSREAFDEITLLESGLLTAAEIELLRPGAARAWRSGLDTGEGPFLVKCHDAYTRLPDGTPLLGGAEAALGAILVVRDPRDIAPSLADHRGCAVDEAIAFMADPDAVQGETRDGQQPQLRQRLSNWSGHASSWLDQSDLPVHVVRYEDLHEAPVATLRKAMAFVGVAAAEDRLLHAIRLSAFDAVRREEQDRGFAEAKPGRRFFRQGTSGGWRTGLSVGQARRIEATHRDVMRRLGYLTG